MKKNTPTSKTPKKVILEADYGWMNDSCINLLYALQCPELEILGVTTVAGNFTLSYAVDCALRILEMLGRTSIPVCPGFDRPLLHERDAYADRVWGKWAVDNIILPFPEGCPTTKPDPRHAIDFIGKTVLENPGEVSILTTGPLTNLAIAIRRYPEIIKAVQQVVIFGGAFSAYPRGFGNITPTAEFNFWVDPEAARIVMHSRLPLTTITMNAGRKTSFKKSYYDRLTETDSVISRILRNSIGSSFSDSPPAHYMWNKAEVTNYGLIAQLVTSYFLRPDLFVTEDMHVEIDTSSGLGYGASYGFQCGEYIDGPTGYPLETNAQIKTIAFDVDFDTTAEMVIKALTRFNK